MDNDFEAAKRILEQILNRESSKRDVLVTKLKERLWGQNKNPQIVERYVEDKYFLSLDCPELMSAKGTKQIVLNLGSGYVGKTRPILWGLDDFYALATSGVYEVQLIKSPVILRELGFEVPEHRYMGVGIDEDVVRVYENGLAFVIAEDLTCSGRYLIKEVCDESLQNLANGNELQEQLTKAIGLLSAVGQEKRLPYFLCVNDHTTVEGLEEAFKHMFFVQIDPTESRGKLVLGDLDHVLFKKVHPR